MPLKKSFITRLFTALFSFLLAVLILVGAVIYSYAQQVVGREFLRLNQASLRQLASAAGRSLTDTRSLAERLAVNSRLLELLAQSGGGGDKEARSIVYDQLNEYLAARNSNHALLDVTILGYNGLCASTYALNAFTLDELRAQTACAPLFSGEASLVVLPTARKPNGTGIMIYTFQIIAVMQDLFTGEDRGLVVLDVSELSLENQYQEYSKGNVQISILDQSGIVLSDREKRRIGNFYGLSGAELKELSAQEWVTRRIVDGQFYLSERIPGTDWLMAERLSAANAFGALTQVRNLIILVIALCGVALLCAFILAARRILRPVMHIKDNMEKVIGGDLAVRIQVERQDEFGRIEESFNTMVAEIERLIEEVKQGEKQKRLAELDFLQAQINPHFIHNTLTSIRFMLEMGKTEQAGEMVFYFSKLLRQTLSRSDEFVTMEEELSTLESYVSLQGLRYRDIFELVQEIAPGTLSARVPALILQPVVENAIFHAVGKSKVHIRIRTAVEEGRLMIRVVDDGVGMSPELRETVLHKDVQINRVGLRNVHDRIRLNYGKEYGLKVTPTEGGGTTITFSLPFAPGEEEQGGEGGDGHEA